METKITTKFNPERRAFDETKGVKGLVDARITEDTLTDKKASDSVSDLEIPTIDLASVQVDTTTREAIVEKVRYAAEKWGFFQVINHGVPSKVLEDMIDGGRRFHENNPEVKESYVSNDIKNNKFVYASSSSPFHWKSSFLGYMSPDPPTPEDLPVICRDAMFEYSKHVMSLGGLLIELLSEALGLNSETLKSMDCLKTLFLACNYYPPCPQPDTTVGMSKHSDNSFLTILLQDNIGGLQVLHQDFWVDVAPLPGALLVNIGDLLQLMTNDKFVSVYHRVLVNRDKPRISIGCFFNSAKRPTSTVYGPIKELLFKENPPKYRNITIEEYSNGYFEKLRNGIPNLSSFTI